MNDLDVNILIQTFNEKIASLVTEIVVKDATIKQLSAKNQALMSSLVPEVTKTKKQQQDSKQSDNFE